jgi:hypothetical protein
MLILRPLTLAAANALVAQLHRHHKPATGHRFSLGAFKPAEAGGERLVGAAIVGRPVARMSDQYGIAEVTRLVTDGTPNAASFLLGATARAAKAMGFAAIQTFTLAGEPGTSLRAAGWRRVEISAGGPWDCPTRPRRRDQPEEPKTRWELRFERNAKVPLNPLSVTQCRRCGAVLEAVRRSRKYCSGRCRIAAWRAREKKR